MNVNLFGSIGLPVYGYLIEFMFELRYYLLITNFSTLGSSYQYGRIIDVELKNPPRMPAYAFVEVSHLL